MPACDVPYMGKSLLHKLLFASGTCQTSVILSHLFPLTCSAGFDSMARFGPASDHRVASNTTVLSASARE
jgi:hypothetical protein